MASPLNRSRVVQGYWKWRRLIDHIRVARGSKFCVPTRPAKIHEFLDPTRPASLSTKRKNHKIHDMTLFQLLVLTALHYWLLISPARILQRRNLRASTVFSFSRDRMPVTVCPMDEKSLSDCAELAGMHRSLRAVSDIMGYSVACFS